MADRDSFLAGIKHKTWAGRYRPTNAPDSVWTRGPDRPYESPPIEDPPARFMQELEALGGHARRVNNLEAARDYVVSLARERRAERLIRWDVEELDALGADDALTQAGVDVAVWRGREDMLDAAANSDIGLSTAEWAVAQTGSLVLQSGAGKGRTVTLLPATYVAIVPVDRMLSTTAEAFGKMHAAAIGGSPVNLCLHTGPSRSGDIEMSLVQGMHGPGDVHVVLVG